MISQSVSLSPASGSVLRAQSLEPASDSVSPSLSAPPLFVLSLSVSLKNKQTLKTDSKLGMQAGAATLGNSTEVPQKTKKRTTLRPSNCTTRHLATGHRCAVSKGHMHPHVYSSTIDNSQSMERAQISINGWMDKEHVVYTYIQWSISNLKEWNLAICNYWMQLEGIMLSETSQRKTNYHRTSFIWGL